MDADWTGATPAHQSIGGTWPLSRHLHCPFPIDMFPFHVWAAVQQVENEFFIVGSHLWRARMEQISRSAAAFFARIFTPNGHLVALLVWQQWIYGPVVYDPQMATIPAAVTDISDSQYLRPNLYD